MEYKFDKNKNIFFLGVRDGIPIALGYFAVSFSLGIMATKSGLSPLQALVCRIYNDCHILILYRNCRYHTDSQCKIPLDEYCTQSKNTKGHTAASHSDNCTSFDR